jgi:hypothetical protein
MVAGRLTFDYLRDPRWRNVWLNTRTNLQFMGNFTEYTPSAIALCAENAMRANPDVKLLYRVKITPGSKPAPRPKYEDLP